MPLAPRQRLLALALAAALTACNGWQHPAVHPTPRSGALRVRVTDGAGAALAGARISVAGRAAPTDGSGLASFEQLTEGGYLLTVDAPGWQPEAAPVVVRFPGSTPAVELTVPLEPVDASDVHLLFAGDLSFEGGIADPNRDGVTNDSLVPSGPGATTGTQQLLEGVAPLLSRFDLVTATLATTLGNGATPHPLKANRAVAPPGVAAAFVTARIDVVNLGNDHAYDYLDDGVRQTLEALDGSSVLRVGAGRDLSEASTPLLASRRGVTVGQVSLSALLGHGTTPRTDMPPYFDARPQKAGVVEASLANIQAEVAQTAQGADLTVAHLAAGGEWMVDPTPLAPLAQAAAAAGAGLVLGHGPRPLQPLFMAQGVLVAGGLGQLVFGSSRTEARSAVLLEARIRQRRLDAVRLWPLAQVHLRPRLATDALAARIVRHLSALSAPSVLVYPFQGRGVVAPSPDSVQTTDSPHQAAVELRALPDGSGATAPLPLLEDDREGFVASASAALASDPARPLSVDLGRELLWDGGFEDQTTGELGQGAGWSYKAPDAGPSDRSVRSGRLALEMVRKSGNLGPATVHGEGLITLLNGHRYTFSGCWRAEGEAKAEASLAVYPSHALGVTATTWLTVPGGPPSTEWSCFSLDYLAQVDTLVTPELRLERPERGTARLFVDDLSLVEWDEQAQVPAQPLVPSEYESLRCRAPTPGGTVAVTWTTRRYLPR